MTQQTHMTFRHVGGQECGQSPWCLLTASPVVKIVRVGYCPCGTHWVCVASATEQRSGLEGKEIVQFSLPWGLERKLVQLVMVLSLRPMLTLLLCLVKGMSEKNGLPNGKSPINFDDAKLFLCSSIHRGAPSPQYAEDWKQGPSGPKLLLPVVLY